MTTDWDVIIMGGGLAGLSLAIQLARERPQTRILVLEKKPHPLPEAAHKVGESSVEIGAHYFAEVLGIKEHILRDELPKLGLRFFFPAQGNQDLTARFEVGTDTYFPARSYQLDRGRLENFLGQEAARLGVTFLSGATTRDVQLDRDGHRLAYSDATGGEHAVTARWAVDASGRASLLKRRLGLQKKVGHQANAVWFRISEKIAIDDWSTQPGWQARNSNQTRWLSTNHLMGIGYWVWLIPLGSGSTSVGIVVDAALHPLEGMSSFDKAMAWIAAHEPQCARMLEPRRAALQDFRMLKDYSYSGTTAFHADRWSCVGEACAFLDPFYSPGSDYIAIGNTMTTRLIVDDLAGSDITANAGHYNSIYFLLFDNNLMLFENQYPIYGNALVMSFKIIWDWAYYWSVSCTIFFHGRLTDLDMFVKIRRSLKRAGRLNASVQRLLRQWHEQGAAEAAPGFLDVARIPVMFELNRGLTDRLDAAQFESRFISQVEQLRRIAGEIAGYAHRLQPQLNMGDFLEFKADSLDLLAALEAMLPVPTGRMVVSV